MAPLLSYLFEFTICSFNLSILGNGAYMAAPPVMYYMPADANVLVSPELLPILLFLCFVFLGRADVHGNQRGHDDDGPSARLHRLQPRAAPVVQWPAFPLIAIVFVLYCVSVWTLELLNCMSCQPELETTLLFRIYRIWFDRL